LEFLSKAEIVPKDVVVFGENDFIKNFEICTKGMIKRRNKILVKA
jgi:hypothetical protein